MSEANVHVERGVVRTLSGYEIEHLFWLAARDVVFFHTWNGDTWDGGWQVGILCNDTFCYAAADAEDLAPGEEGKLREFYERHGWAGVVAWCAWKRGIEPLKELQNDAYLVARAELTHNVKFRGGGAATVQKQAEAAVPPSSATEGSAS